MPIDPGKAKALAFDPIEVTVERGQLAFFAQATGQTDPVYADIEAARAAGHPDLPVPPTFFFSLELASPDPLGYLGELGIDLRDVLHGEQAFTYRTLAYAGQTLTLQPEITDVASKKGGALELLTKQTDITCAGEPVAQTRSVVIVRHPEVTA